MIDVLKILFWMLRGNETDVIKIYNYLTPVIQLANGGLMLNRGYWKNNAKNPLQAQHQLCTLIGEFADFRSAKRLLDVGSGLSIPAIHWTTSYNFLQTTCLDINFQGLKTAAKESKAIVPDRSITVNSNRISFMNASATKLPFSNNSVDRIIALESSHHFKPFELFLDECKRVLTEKGMLIIATPIKNISTEGLTNLRRFGIISFFMPSKNYLLENLKSTIASSGFMIADMLHIGSQVYEPLTNYYVQNRNMLRKRILKEYPSYVETLLYKSLLKSTSAYNDGVLDYVLIKSTPN